MENRVKAPKRLIFYPFGFFRVFPFYPGLSEIIPVFHRRVFRFPRKRRKSQFELRFAVMSFIVIESSFERGIFSATWSML